MYNPPGDDMVSGFQVPLPRSRGGLRLLLPLFPLPGGPQPGCGPLPLPVPRQHGLPPSQPPQLPRSSSTALPPGTALLIHCLLVFPLLGRP